MAVFLWPPVFIMNCFIFVTSRLAQSRGLMILKSPIQYES